MTTLNAQQIESTINFLTNDLQHCWEAMAPNESQHYENVLKVLNVQLEVKQRLEELEAVQTEMVEELETLH